MDVTDSDRARWDARHAEAGPPGAAPAWLAAFDAVLPRRGRALDVACGTGRVALFARARGLAVTAVDVSPIALARLREAAPDVVTVERDLEADPRLPEGPFELVTCFRYRQPSLWPALIAALAPGGIVAAEVLARDPRGASHEGRFRAEPGELPRCAAGLAVLHAAEGELDGVYTARILARR